MLRVEGLCLGIHETWSAGGADAGDGAAGSISRERSLFLERREDQKERCLVGETPGGVYFVPDACSTPREEIYTWVEV